VDFSSKKKKKKKKAKKATVPIQNRYSTVSVVKEKHVKSANGDEGTEAAPTSQDKKDSSAEVTPPQPVTQSFWDI
jgi:hypothetical protein